ncbi:MAG: hypothetical protein HUU25_06510 [Candidatus Sumerlaeia bacterium]|nr:hypothetical protein [Candidatus Sumerlaeia bacterium]
MSLRSVLWALAPALAAPASFAGPYASQIAWSSPAMTLGVSVVDVRYYLSSQADAVTIEVVPLDGGPAVASFSGPSAPGPHAVAWNGRTDNAAGPLVPPGPYHLRVRVQRADGAAWELVRSNSTPNGAGHIQTLPGTFPSSGVAIDINPENPRFGQIFVSVSTLGATNGPHGALLVHPDLQPADLTQLYIADLPWVGGSTSDLAPWGIHVAPDGEIWATGSTPGGGGVELARGLPDGTGDRDVGSAHPMVDQPPDVWVTGTGANRVIRWTQGTLGNGAVMRAAIGDSPTLDGVPVIREVDGASDQGFYGRSLCVDDGGNLYILTRVSQIGGVTIVYRFDAAALAAGPLPLNTAQAAWAVTVAAAPSLAGAGLAIDHRNRADAGDDIIYALLPLNAPPAGTQAGIYRVGISGTATRTLVLTPDDRVVDLSAETISGVRADIACDWGGNIVMEEPFNEELRIYAPPGPSDVTTPGPSGQILTATAPGEVPGVEAIADHILGLVPLEGDDLAAADLEPDGRIDAADLVRRAALP